MAVEAYRVEAERIDTAGLILDEGRAAELASLNDLLGDSDPDTKNQLIPLAEYAAKGAQQRFAGSYNFFDAVMPAHAGLAIRIIERTLATSADTLTKAYHEAVLDVPSNARQFDSGSRKLRLLARYYTLRGPRDDLHSAAALREVR